MITAESRAEGKVGWWVRSGARCLAEWLGYLVRRQWRPLTLAGPGPSGAAAGPHLARSSPQ